MEEPDFIEMDSQNFEFSDTDSSISQESFVYGESDGNLCSYQSVKGQGRLKNAIHCWKDIHTSEFILETIEQGYKIPFFANPSPYVRKNNKSAYDHSSFVDEAISVLLSDNRVEEVFEMPTFINPLSVSVHSSGKKRLILDLRHINLFIYKQKFKCEDLSTLREITKPGDLFFTFDLKSGYHHLDILPGHRKFLSFCWWLNSNLPRYFQITVLPFRLSSAPFIFTKLLRPVVSHWRSRGIPIVVYLDDGIGASHNPEKCSSFSFTVRSTLCNLGFVINEEKSAWNPSTTVAWLGCVIDSKSGIIKASDKRIDKLQLSLNDICSTLDSTYDVIPFNVRSIASVIGSIISLYNCCGNVTRIKSRYLYFIVNTRKNWNSTVILDDDAYRELSFWKSNLKSLNGIPFWKSDSTPVKVVYTDASRSGCGPHVNFDNHVFQTNWTEAESSKSSTWRELAAVYLALTTYVDQVKNNNVTLYTDNQNVVSIIECGSKVRELQDLALDIFVLCNTNQVCLCPLWLPRDQNTVADDISKTIDYDDYSVQDDVFFYLDRLWGPHTIDRFACFYNAKVDRFNSRFFQPGTEAVDAFLQNWSFDNNWLVPPISRIGMVISHMKSRSARGSLVVPLWRSAYFWTLLCSDGVHWNNFVHDWVVLPPFSEVFIQGRAKNKFFSSSPNNSPVVALYIDFLVPPRLDRLGVFCTSPHCNVHKGSFQSPDQMYNGIKHQQS